MENVPNKHGPCLDKKCGRCCDPVRVYTKSGGNLPKDKKGKTIFVSRGEIVAPEKYIDTVRLATYDCVNFDKEKNICLDHENRPDMCRNTSCVSNEDEDADTQHKRMVEEKFIVIKRKSE